MRSVLTSLLLALRQLADRRILAILAKSLAVSLALFAATGIAGWYLVDAALAWAGLADGTIPGANVWRGAVAGLLAAIGLWLTWRIVAMAVIQFFADDVVAAVEARHYPGIAGTARDLPMAEQAGASLRSAGRALLANLAALPVALALLFTAIGPALVFFIVNGWLLGRELQDMVWQRHRRNRAHAPPVRAGERFVLGGAIAALLLVPFANLLAPIIGAAAATHLVHRRKWS